MAAPSFPSNSATEELKYNLLKEIRSHEVAMAELNNISSSRTIYQKSGNIFFKVNSKTATASTQRQLDLLKPQLQKLNSV